MLTIKSSLPPALYTLPGDTSYRVAGGHVISVNGVDLAISPPIPLSVGYSDIVWQPTNPTNAVQPKSITVQGKTGTYIVKIAVNGVKSCSCPGYSFRRTCKHLVQV